MVIDCNSNLLSISRGLLRMPKVISTTILECKIVGNNFDTIVQNFTNLQELTYITEDFIQIDQNLIELKFLKKFTIVCAQQDEVIDELRNEFSIKFFDSQ